MDIMVLATQQWLNVTYSGRYGYNEIEEDGMTGWNTIYALIRALQIELGISEPSDNFGNLTLAECPTLSINSDQLLIIDSNIVRIIQCAMFCKGYSPSDITGNFGVETKAGIQQMQSDAGLSNSDGVVTPLLFKALLTMDAYVLLSGGNTNIRTIQRNLNRDYYPSIGGLLPCDGIYGRATCKAMIMALQIEGGVGVDGIWGPNTVATLPVLTYGNTNMDYNYLLQYALYANGFDPNGFDGYFGNGCRTAVQNFQGFCALSVDGVVGAQTWASLMISKGDTNRSATACDCSSTVTSERAATLYNNGYRIVGRYLTGGWKEIKAGEIETIFDAGLKIFPIYQTSGDESSYFNYGRGAVDAAQAIIAAKGYGFESNTIIYFAVDFDAMDYQVTNNILPYFHGIYDQFANMNSNYRIGIYGPRNICSRVGDAGYSCSSFVADMSSGFSGNIGYPLPDDWNFDQILEYSIGSGDGQIVIDKDIFRSNYMGESSIIDPVGVTTSDIVAIANNLDGMANRIGVVFTSPDVEVIFIQGPPITLSASFSVSSVFSQADGISATVQDGQIYIGSNVYDISGTFGVDSVKLAAKISSWEGIDFKVSITQTANSITISLINQFNAEYFDQIGYITEKINITFSDLDENNLETQIATAFDNVVAWVDDNSESIIGFLVIVGIVIVIGAVAWETIAVLLASIFQALMTYALPIVCILFFVKKILDEFFDDDVS